MKRVQRLLGVAHHFDVIARTATGRLARRAAAEIAAQAKSDAEALKAKLADDLADASARNVGVLGSEDGSDEAN